MRDQLTLIEGDARRSCAITLKTSNVSLVQNNCTIRELCPKCGDFHKDSEIPAWVFSGEHSLCGRCAKTFAPDLHRIAREIAMLCFSFTGERDYEAAYAIVESAMGHVPRISDIRWNRTSKSAWRAHLPLPG